MEPLKITAHKFLSTSVAPHDFSITKNFYIFIENRVMGDTLPYILGTKCPAECVNIDSSKPMVLNIVRRPHEGNITMTAWSRENSININLTPGFTIHSVCAFERPKLGGENAANYLELYTTAWKCETVAAGEVKGGLLGSWEGAAPNFDQIPVTLLYRTLVDIDTQKVISHAPFPGMEDTIVEHPHINPCFEGKPVRYVYMSIGSEEGVSSPPLGYLRLDIVSGEKQVWFAPLHTYCEELVVVCKANVNSVGAEDSVWLLGTMYDAVEDKSYLAIFDGEKVSDGPISRLWLTHRLPHSLHGSFTPLNF
jgi:all-trans-8'-apo-beta-carotenal 15,15'-oxygenase